MSLDPLLRAMPRLAPGHVWLAGAGPGDPGHLTLHAVSALAQADLVVHDALVDPRVLALAPPGAERRFAGKRGGKPSADQADIIATLIAEARAGRRVLRLKGGDPFVFGRGGEEVLALARAGVPFRVIPGLTAGLAGLAAASIPATMRGVNQAIVLATGHGGDAAEGLDWAALARLGQPVVLYMATRTLPAIAAALMRGGMAPETPAAIVEAATTGRQRVEMTTLGGLPALSETRGDAPAVIAIGAIVALRGRLRALAAEVTEGFPWPQAG